VNSNNLQSILHRFWDGGLFVQFSPSTWVSVFNVLTRDEPLHSRWGNLLRYWMYFWWIKIFKVNSDRGEECRADRRFAVGDYLVLGSKCLKIYDFFTFLKFIKIRVIVITVIGLLHNVTVVHVTVLRSEQYTAVTTDTTKDWKGTAESTLTHK